LTCFLTRRRLGAYLDGALDDRDQRAAGAHVESCDRCRREIADLRHLQARLRQVLAAAPPADWSGFWEGVARGIERERRVPRPRAWPVPSLASLRRHRLATGGALAALLVVSVTAWQFLGTPEPQEAGVVVRSARTELPNRSVMVYSSPEQDLAVVWVLDEE
jgi:anti-sigma factor RsiW